MFKFVYHFVILYSSLDSLCFSHFQIIFPLCCLLHKPKQIQVFCFKNIFLRNALIQTYKEFLLLQYDRINCNQSCAWNKNSF